MNENELIVAGSQVDVHFKHFQFVAAVFVEADLANAEHVGLVNEMRNERPKREASSSPSSATATRRFARI
jgi:hypothetical protein